MIKKLLVLLLAILMVFTVASCDKKGDDEEGASAAPEQESENDGWGDGLPETDMEKFELKILHDSGEYMTWAEVQLDAEAYNGAVTNDAVYTRNRAIENRFNCVITVDGRNCVLNEDIRQSYMAGESPYDIYYTISWGPYKIVDCLVDLNEIPFLSLDQDWWHPEARSLCVRGESQFAAVSSFSLAAASVAGGYLFNADLYRELDFEKSMYEYVYNDEWTFETFYQLCSDIARPEDYGIEAIYGVGRTSVKSMYQPLINGAGIAFAAVNEDGQLEFTLGNNINSYMDKLLKIATVGNGEIYSIDNPVDMQTEVSDGSVLKGTALFWSTSIYNLSKPALKTSGISYGFMPYPKYDTDQTEYYSRVSDFEMMCILKTIDPDRLYNIGLIMEALSYYSHETVLKQYLEETVTFREAPDQDCMNVMLIIQDSLFFDAGATLIINPVDDLLKSMFIEGGGGNISSALEMHTKTIQAQIDKFNSGE